MPDSSPILQFAKNAVRHSRSRLKVVAKDKQFRRGYLVAATVLLPLSTLYWALLGARLQIHNADQLSDPYLFSNWATFHQAVFPSAHTFLLKWPVFWLVSLFGVSAASLATATAAMALLTVSALAYLLYRIERRALVLGTLFLALGLALLLVPTQPYAGGILPVNMAMLTTRNLEYVVYLASLVLFARTDRLWTRRFVGGILLLTLLFASDKLFLSLSVGGAMLSLLVYALVRNWALVTFATRWLVGSIVAAVGSSVALLGISAMHITHFGSAGASPYALVSSVKNGGLGVLYAGLGLLTNTGANPAYDNRLIGRLPAELLHRLLSLSGLLHIVAAAVLAYALVLLWRLVWPTVHVVPRRVGRVPVTTQLGLALTASSVTALGTFALTDHYYAVDARYLTICLFTLTITAATMLRKRRWQRPERLVLVGLALASGLVLASVTAYGTASHQATALDTTDMRNQLVAQALRHHRVNVLVGDYWRVLPVKLASRGRQNVLPLQTCTQPNATLTSGAWQPNLNTHSFAYLITFDGSLTNFPHCNLTDVTGAYGRPNATETIAGTLLHPREVLLFYDHGRHTNPPLPKRVNNASALLPLMPDQLLGTNCSGPTIMTVVAHQDDDILFTSPDLLHDLQAGHCVRTAYLTAGDSGLDKFYWLGRQIGAEAAYSQMLGDKAGWVQRTVQLSSQAFVTVASPADNTKVSLIFFNLPDGNLQGDGFPVSHDQSLAKLLAGAIPSMATVDSQSTYTLGQLESALVALMNTYQPAEIRSQADVVSSSYPDHSDHIATGKITAAAAELYDQQKFEGKLSLPFTRYIGYPVHGYPANVSGNDLTEKEAAFLAYAQYDGGVCHSVVQCSSTPTYGAYISRQYQEDQATP